MNRLTDALKRAHGGIPLPASSAAVPEDPFSAEEAPRGGAPAQANTAPRPQDDAIARVPPPSAGQHGRQRESRTNGSRSKTTPVVCSSVNAKVVERVATPGGAPPVMTEEYRRIAAVLHHAQMNQGTKVLMVTSACPGEGKTLTAANLALTLSQSYERRVLLIDADLRKPAVHDLFDLKNAAGLVDALRADPAKEDRTVPVVQVSSRLQLLLTGGVPPDPVSLLTSDALRALVKDSSEAFDWVIIDTPPAAFLPDCKLLSTMVDATVLVVRAFVTPYPLVQQVVDAVGHDKIMGVVLNHAEHTHGGSYYYDSGYYGYYGGYYGATPTR
jgi:capsular exopolysaccharide synthesis family protein